MDDPTSILRCSNKVFLQQLMERHKIATPKTLLIHPRNIKMVETELGFACVLKQPDSAFSKGVIKVRDAAELKRKAGEMLERSDIIVAQAFEPTDYDWRIGVLDGKPLYACRYFMAKNHWQIVKRTDGGGKDEGKHETLDIADVPAKVLETAVRAANSIGKSLYGVDLKQSGSSVKVIEVNDNPNLDFGIEDLFLGEALYDSIMRYFLQRLEQRTREPVR